MRDEERESLKKSYEDEIRKLERDRHDLKQKLSAKDETITKLNQDLEKLKSDYKFREQ